MPFLGATLPSRPSLGLRSSRGEAAREGLSGAVGKDRDTLHIAFGVDENYVHPMGVTITSIVENNPGLDLVFHVFIAEISQANRERLEQLEIHFRKPIDIHPIEDLAEIREQNVSKSHAYISKAAYTRLLIPEALQGVTDRVLYLDADILCVGNVARLLEMDVGDTAAAVIRDINAPAMCSRLAEKGLALGDYFNSGVLYINIPRWIATGVSERTLEKIADPVLNLGYFDQDALNIVLDGSVRFIDRTWNYQYGLTGRLKKVKDAMDVPSNTKFVHFIGPMKPWRTWNPHESKSLFLKYQKRSPWAGINLDDGFTPREFYVYSKFMYRLMFRQRRWLQGLVWYGKFLRRKYLAE